MLRLNYRYSLGAASCTDDFDCPNSGEVCDSRSKTCIRTTGKQVQSEECTRQIQLSLYGRGLLTQSNITGAWNTATTGALDRLYGNRSAWSTIPGGPCGLQPSVMSRKMPSQPSPTPSPTPLPGSVQPGLFANLSPQTIGIGILGIVAAITLFRKQQDI